MDIEKVTENQQVRFTKSMLEGKVPRHAALDSPIFGGLLVP
jgi:hypothetical protein